MERKNLPEILYKIIEKKWWKSYDDGSFQKLLETLRPKFY